jgi:hypothetical protein
MGLEMFLGGEQGPWQVISLQTLHGEALPLVSHIAQVNQAQSQPHVWCLRGIPSYVRYTTAAEQVYLREHQPPLHRSEATMAALIPIHKSPAWWELAQDERRAIFEERSHHIALGTGAFPAVARRLLHSRDLGEPFDFLTWFEYAPEHAPIFEDLLGTLRMSEEWQYVDREIDIRLQRLS